MVVESSECFYLDIEQLATGTRRNPIQPLWFSSHVRPSRSRSVFPL